MSFGLPDLVGAGLISGLLARDHPYTLVSAAAIPPPLPSQHSSSRSSACLKP